MIAAFDLHWRSPTFPRRIRGKFYKLYYPFNNRRLSFIFVYLMSLLNRLCTAAGLPNLTRRQQQPGRSGDDTEETGQITLNFQSDHRRADVSVECESFVLPNVDLSSLSVEELFQTLNTSRAGLTSSEAAERLINFGPNILGDEDSLPQNSYAKLLLCWR